MAAGYIASTLIPGWPSPVIGVMEQLYQTLHDAGFINTPALAPEGLYVPDISISTSFLASYVGSASELSFHKTLKQSELDAFFDANFVLTEFIRNGTSTSITGANVGAFLAQITNNYRSLRIQIQAATAVAQVDAINVKSGWPANP